VYDVVESKVRTGGYILPRHPTRFEPLFIDFNRIL
jgi:hypothetical protein